MTAVPEVGRFITEDEIAASLANGSGFEGGKARIYELFQTPHTPKESADFLKKEYGVGGRTHAVSRESGSYRRCAPCMERKCWEQTRRSAVYGAART